MLDELLDLTYEDSDKYKYYHLFINQKESKSKRGHYKCQEQEDDLAIKVSGSVDTSKVGAYELTYSATNHYGETTDKVVIINVYAEKPVITGIDAKTIKVGEQFDPMAGVKATSKYGQEEVSVSGHIDNQKAGEYTLTYRVKDQYSELSFERVITVVEQSK